MPDQFHATFAVVDFCPCHDFVVGETIALFLGEAFGGPFFDNLVEVLPSL
jgi:hypothetical protein